MNMKNDKTKSEKRAKKVEKIKEERKNGNGRRRERESGRSLSAYCSYSPPWVMSTGICDIARNGVCHRNDLR